MTTPLFGLDPLFNTNVKLFVKDVLALVPTEDSDVGFFKFHDHIIRLAEICGIIVAVENTNANILYTVDDSSGTIDCCLWRNDLPTDYIPFEIATTVRVQGRITTFGQAKQIIIYDIIALDDPDEEYLHYIQTALLEAEHQKPYCLPDSIGSNKNLLEDELVREDASFENFIIAILYFLKEKAEGTFTVWLPRKDPVLIQAAKEILEQHSTVITDKKILRLFEKALGTLSDRGFVVRSKHMENRFDLVNVIEVQSLIIEIVSKALEKSNIQKGGIRADHIRKSVLDKYKNMNKTTIDLLIEQLLNEGILITTSFGEYKTTLAI